MFLASAPSSSYAKHIKMVSAEANYHRYYISTLNINQIILQNFLFPFLLSSLVSEMTYNVSSGMLNPTIPSYCYHDNTVWTTVCKFTSMQAREQVSPSTWQMHRITTGQQTQQDYRKNNLSAQKTINIAAKQILHTIYIYAIKQHMN